MVTGKSNNTIGESNSETTQNTSLGVDLNMLKCKNSNFYSKVLFYIGWAIIILGVIGTIIITENSYYGFAVFIAGLLSSATFGFLILGLSEIINILDENRTILTDMIKAYKEEA